MLDMTARGHLTNRRPEGLLSVIARHGEDNALEAAVAGEMAVDLLHLDPRGLVQRESSYPGPEGHQSQAPGAELVGLDQRARRRAADDLGRRRSSQLHGRRVDHPTAWHLARRRLDRLPETDRGTLVAFGLHRGSACPRDRSRNSATVAELGVRRVRDRVDLQLGDVRLPDLDSGHVRQATGGEEEDGIT
jgi:hypothetical protein